MSSNLNSFVDENGVNCAAIQSYFEKEILSEETVRLIPSFASPSLKNNSLVKLDEILIIQDCIEDEFYQPTIKGTDGGLMNCGLWTRSIYDPEGTFTCSNEVNCFNELQVRKRLLATCKQTGKPLILSIYRTCGSEEDWEKWRQETFKMNSMHSVIGIYEECDVNNSINEEGEVEGDFVLPNVHLMKRIDHLIPDLIPIESESEVKLVKSKLISYLTECFGDCKELIDALILLLVSKPSMRVDGLIDSLFIGKLSLNICFDGETGISESISSLRRIFKELKHFNTFVKIDEESFDKEGGIYPRLDVKTGQILPGAVLQQPDGCLLMLDETELKEGQVFKDQAVQNLQSLIDLIRQQRVNYDFGVQQVSLKTDMPVVTVSRRKKSVLPFDLSVKCASTVAFIESDDFKLFKSYLEHARNLNFTVTEDMASFLEQDYLNLRKTSPRLPTGNPKMNEQEFHRLMNLARLKAVSSGERELSKETWEETKALYL